MIAALADGARRADRAASSSTWRRRDSWRSPGPSPIRTRSSGSARGSSRRRSCTRSRRPFPARTPIESTGWRRGCESWNRGIKSILLVCSILDWPWIREAYQRRRRRRSPSRSSRRSRRFRVDPANLIFVLGELPYITSLYERGRSELTPDDNLSVDGIKEMVLDARERLGEKHPKIAERITPQLLSIYFRYIRNLSLLDRRLTPDLYTLIVAAQQTAGDDFALALAETARSYPLHAERARGRAGLRRRTSRGWRGWGSTGASCPSGARADGQPAAGPGALVADVRAAAQAARRRSRRGGGSAGTRSGCARILPRTTGSRASIATCATRPRRSSAPTWRAPRSSRRACATASTSARPCGTGTPASSTSRSCRPAAARSKSSSSSSIFRPTPRSTPTARPGTPSTLEESTLAFYATDPMKNLVGPGIAQAEYGGALFLFPPRPIPDIWTDKRLDFTDTLEERLLAGGVPAQQGPARRRRQPQDSRRLVAPAGAPIRPEDRPPAAQAVRRPAARAAAHVPRLQRQAGPVVRGRLHSRSVIHGGPMPSALSASVPLRSRFSRRPSFPPTEPFDAPKYGLATRIPKDWTDRRARGGRPDLRGDHPAAATSTARASPPASWRWRRRAWTSIAPGSTRTPRRTAGPAASSPRTEVIKDARGERLETIWEFHPDAGGFWREVSVRIIANRQLYTFILNVEDSVYAKARPAFDALVIAARASRPPNTGADLLAKKSNRWIQREYRFALDLPEGWQPALAPSEVALLFANGPPMGIWSDNLLVLAHPHRNDRPAGAGQAPSRPAQARGPELPDHLVQGHRAGQGEGARDRRAHRPRARSR